MLSASQIIFITCRWSMSSFALLMLASACKPAAAFNPAGPAALHTPKPARSRSALRMGDEGSSATAVPTLEVAKIFGRLTEKMLYLDKNVGDCCHSACSDCEWRKPDGGYRFDYLRSARPKWIPCYLSREYLVNDGGCHVPVWVKTFFPDGVESNTPISHAEFKDRLQALKYAPCMGPRGSIRPDESPSPEALDLFWSYLSGGVDEPPAEKLEPSALLQRLQDMSQDENREGEIGEGPDSVDWRSFANALGVKPM
mmetsp:Transcript_4656/g.8497  ORF Transcript_4656/g.8497 Transcript_4656/m.8497 type:complete len:255 (-) Transcript_4656:2-766(-)